MINVDDRVIKSKLRHIGPDALSVWLCLSTFMNAENICYPSQKTILEMTGMGRDKTRKAFKVLIENKIITKLKQFHFKDSGKWSNSHYKLNTDFVKFYVETKTPCTENQSTVTPCTENPSTVNQSTISINNIISINNKQDVVFSQFKKFHSMYLGSKRKAETEYTDFIDHHKEVAQKIIPELSNIVERQNKDYQAKKDKGEFVPNLKHLKNYLKSKHWEFEPEQAISTNTSQFASYVKKQKK